MGKIIAIATNALTETTRQPVFIIILAGGALMIALSPSFAMFTLMNSIKLVKDMGLATILLSGFLQVIFSAANVVSQEIEDKTVQLVLSKPISKTQFILGKYLGIAVALAASTYLLSLILILTIRVGVPEAAYVKLHRPVIIGEILAFSVAIIIAVLINYFYDRPFCSSCFISLLLSFTLVFILVGFIDKDLNFQRFCVNLDASLISASYLILIGLLTIAAVAIALSIRFGLVPSIILCISIFMLGLLSDYIFGRFIETNILARAAYALVPNMQVFWVTDAIVAGRAIPARYLLSVTRYAVVYQIAALILSIFLFERRETP